MKNYSVSRRTVTNVAISLESLMKKAENANVSFTPKKLKEAPFAVPGSGIMSFISLARSAEISVTHSIIAAKAIYLGDKILLKDLPEWQACVLRQFSASREWTDKFVNRHGLQSVALHGEAGSVDIAGVAADIAELRAKVREYKLQNIYNMDETGLILNFFPGAHIYAHMKTRSLFVVPREGMRKTGSRHMLGRMHMVHASC